MLFLQLSPFSGQETAPPTLACPSADKRCGTPTRQSHGAVGSVSGGRRSSPAAAHWQTPQSVCICGAGTDTPTTRRALGEVNESEAWHKAGRARGSRPGSGGGSGCPLGGRWVKCLLDDHAPRRGESQNYLTVSDNIRDPGHQVGQCQTQVLPPTDAHGPGRPRVHRPPIPHREPFSFLAKTHPSCVRVSRHPCKSHYYNLRWPPCPEIPFEGSWCVFNCSECVSLTNALMSHG